MFGLGAGIVAEFGQNLPVKFNGKSAHGGRRLRHLQVGSGGSHEVLISKLMVQTYRQSGRLDGVSVIGAGGSGICAGFVPLIALPMKNRKHMSRNMDAL